KYRFQADDKTDFTLSAIWTPYEGEYFLNNTRNSSFTVDGGGVSLNATIEREFDFGKFESILAWRQSENSRRAQNDFYSYDADGASTPWGIGYSKYSQEGGNGDVDTLQSSWTIANHVEFKPVRLLSMEHQVSAGATYERTVADYDRLDTTLITQWTDYAGLVCDGSSDNCISGEQYAKKMWVYGKDSASAEITFVDLYLEDNLTWGHLTLRPGVHVGYNDLTKNTDYAARSLASYDLFNDKRSILHFGANRYYGKTFLTYSLNEEKIGSTYWKRSLDGDSPAEWVDSTVLSRSTRFSSLKTPRVDEWSIGFEQQCFGGFLVIDFIDRNSEDSLAYTKITTDDGVLYQELNNNGEGRHKELTLSWERQWQSYYLFVDATWQDSETSNEDYADRLEDEDLAEIVWYNEHGTYLIDLPRADYNREWSANLIYSTTLPHGFSFTNIIRYRSGYEAIGDTGENYLLDGEKIDIFDDISYPSATTFDWKIEWEYPVTETQTLTISADITNVFNRRIYTGIEGRYQMGRQLWVGVDYSF
ncbi:MAG: TonB-dependent receptor, partial [Deltaproteobacteria bacterium]|nr:TonB-dependent receptor [Deltaproteobacteria bacterium]